MSHYKPYPAYKDSGVEWLGRVPEHWEKSRLGRIADIESGYPFPAEQFGFDGIPVVRMSDLDDGVVCLDSIKRVPPENVPGKSLASAGDILIGLSGSISNFAVVNESDLPLAINQRVGVVRPDKSDGQYVMYFLRSLAFSEQILSRLPETTILNISMDQVRSCALVWPPEAERIKIAVMLDHETARIDGLVARKIRFIELLREKRQALITHAITKGLDPTVKMKDSGVEWLGEVPQHWAVRRLKFIATVQTGVAKGKDNSEKSTVEVPYLRVANVQDGYLDLDEVATIEIPAEDLVRYSLQSGDVLMNEGGDFDKLGRGHVWQGEIDPCIHQNHVFAVRPHSVISEWLNTFTGSTAAQFYFMGRSKQSTNLASISSTNLMEISVPVPPESEQRETLVLLGSKTARFDNLMIKTERSITLLKERRSALITAAVTGQIDLREAV